MDVLEDLPEEVKDALAEHELSTAEKLAALGRTIAEKRDEAVKYRKASGIEDIWQKAEEAYLGIDDATRAGFAAAKWIKSPTLNGPVMTVSSRTNEGEVKSDAFVRLTSRYVDAGVAKLCEILLPVGEKAFSFSATPVPELISAVRDTRQLYKDGIPLERNALPGESAQLPGATSIPPGGSATTPPAAPPSAPGTPTVPLTVKDLAEESIESANAAAKKAERRVYDWMTESQFPAEMRKVIFDSARIGTGVLKAPYPRKKVSRALSKTNGRTTLGIKTDFVPGYSWADVWNIYPDPACGENISNGDYCLEVDFFSKRQLRDLKGQPGYIGGAIDSVLKAGPSKSSAVGEEETKRIGTKVKDNRFPIWYYYGTLTREDMIAAGAIGVGEGSPETVYAVVTLVNDTVIRATMNPAAVSGKFPYHAVPWQRRVGFWAGVGVGEQLEMPQRAINAATRTMFNNAGKSGGSVVVVDDEALIPVDGIWSITPDKIFRKAVGSISDDVRKAFAFFQVPNVTPQMLSIIEYCLRLAEESTSIPLVTQGQSGKTTPETFGATQLQNNNANQLLRSIGYAFDDYITEPVVEQSYEMLLLDDTVPDEEKGDWKIDAHGSIALIERAIQDQTIEQMGQFIANPIFEVHPGRWFAEYSKTKHLNPKNFQYTEAEKAKMASQPPPPPPAVQVAQIRSADARAKLQNDQWLAELSATLELEGMQAEGSVKLHLAKIKERVDEMRIQRDIDRDTVYVQAETRRTQNEYDARMRELGVKRELAILEYANNRELSLEDVKAELAKETMRLQTQKELAGVSSAVELHKAGVKQVATPAVEPAGKAPPGTAFQA